VSSAATEGEPRDPSDTGYLTDVLAMLWPAYHADGDMAPNHAGSSTDLCVVPNLSQPRLVLPATPWQATAGALRRGGEPLTSSRALKQEALRLSMRCGIGQRLFGEHVRVAHGSAERRSSIEGHLEDVLGAPVRVSLRLGPPRNNRKPVLRVLSPGGETLAFVKVGINPVTQRLVRAEGDALAVVAAQHLQFITAPTVIALSNWNGLDVLVQSPLHTPRGPARPEQAALIEAMHELSRATGTSAHAVTESSWWRERTRSSGDLPARIRDAVRRVEQVASGVVIEFGAWHGDWARWNMAVTSTSLNLWDWERFETDVPIGFDALHFRLQDIKSQMPRETAIRTVCEESARLLAPFGVAGDVAPVVCVLYLLDLALRYTQDFRALDGATWGFSGSPMLEPLLAFITSWSP
jgi:hypothetical protein